MQRLERIYLVYKLHKVDNELPKVLKSSHGGHCFGEFVLNYDMYLEYGVQMSRTLKLSNGVSVYSMGRDGLELNHALTNENLHYVIKMLEKFIRFRETMEYNDANKVNETLDKTRKNNT